MPETISPEPADGQAAEHLIALFRSLADPIRLRIVRLLESYSQLCGSENGRSGMGPAGDGGLSVGELGQILKLPQSTVSRHLKTLSDAGLAEPRREGTSTFYRLVDGMESSGSRQLRHVARSHLDNDPRAQNDGHRLASVLRNRETPRGGSDSFFGKHAPQWDQLRAEWFGDTFHLEGMLALLDPEWVVADVGTGTGLLLPLVAPHVKQVIAVDPSAAMLKGARNRVRELALGNVDIRQGTAERLPIDSQGVDVALLALVLAYTAEPRVVMKEVRRILKPGGVVLILDLQPHRVELFREKLNHRWMGFSREQLQEWLTEAGFGSMRWHPLTPRESRVKDAPGTGRVSGRGGGRGRKNGGMPIPDLFAMRAQVVDKD